MELLPENIDEELPKYRIIGVEDIVETQKTLNDLHAQGYSLEAISQNFMLLTIKEVDPMDALTRMAMAKMAQGGRPGDEPDAPDLTGLFGPGPGQE